MADQEGFGVGGLGGQPEIARLVGEFIARWSLAESALLMPLLVAMDSHDQEQAAARLASTNSTNGRIALVGKAVEKMTARPHLKAPIAQALNKLEKLCDERNALCHHLWAVGLSTNAAVTINYRIPVGKPKRITVRSDAYLRSLCDRTVEAARDICAASNSTWVDDDDLKRLRLTPAA